MLKKTAKQVSHQEIYEKIYSEAEVDSNYILLLLFATVMATLGAAQDSLYAIIGAMLIAPLLGPNLAFALGVSSCNFTLLIRATLKNVAGIVVCVVVAFSIGLFMHHFLPQYIQPIKMQLNFNSIIIALATGAAAVISLVSGISGTLIGIMLAGVLLIPTVLFGFSMGIGQYFVGLQSLLLLVINIVCIILSANIMFLAKGFTPSILHRKGKRLYFLVGGFFVMALIVMVIAILFILHLRSL